MSIVLAEGDTCTKCSRFPAKNGKLTNAYQSVCLEASLNQEPLDRPRHHLKLAASDAKRTPAGHTMLAILVHVDPTSAGPKFRS